MNDFTCTLRVTATKPDVAHVSVRQQRFSVGAPIEFDLQSPRVSSVEYALGAVGAEIVSGLQAFARRRRVRLDEVEAVVTGELENPLTYLEVVGEAGRPRIRRVHVKVYAASSGGEEKIRRLWEQMLPRLPLVSTLEGAVPVEIALTLTA
jgi:hypothetical protein